MDEAPRPDAHRLGTRPTPSSGTMVWVGVAAIVGLLALLVIVQIKDPAGATPPTSLFAAAGALISVVAFVTVTLAARSAGIAFRAAVTLAGGLAVIAVVKFTLGPIAIFSARPEVQVPFGLGSAGSVVAIAAVVLALYTGAIMGLGSWLRPRGWASWPRATTAFALLIAGIGGLVGGAFFTNAPIGYVGYALTGVEATAVIVSLFVAATLVAAASATPHGRPSRWASLPSTSASCGWRSRSCFCSTSCGSCSCWPSLRCGL
jgi:hypothetical protein